MKTKGGFFSLLQIILLAFLLGSAASLYSTGGFGLEFSFFLILSAAVSSPVLLGIYRRFGQLVSLGLMIAFGVGIFTLVKDPATGILICALCFSIPLAAGFLWPIFCDLGRLTRVVLPVSGGLVAGGFLIYCKLHFGAWSPYAAVERIAGRIGLLLEQVRPLYAQIYQDKMLEEMNAFLDLFLKNAESIAREVVFLCAYGFLGLFYFSILWADRIGVRQGQISGCGSWSQLVPGRAISWMYMLTHLIMNFINVGPLYQAVAATMTLFGFYYVFSAVYVLDRFLRKKNLPTPVRVLIAGLLFLAALGSAGNALFTPYSILMYVGWWMATSPRRTI